jgi:two-component system sensor histidine kinase KdpD
MRVRIERSNGGNRSMPGRKALHNRTANLGARFERLRADRASAEILWRSYLIALVAVALVSLLLLALRSSIGTVSISMVYLLCTLLVALLVGRGPAILAALATFALYDLFFLPPYNTFKVASSDHILALAVFLIVALVISDLVSRARERARAAEQEEARAQLLFQLNEGLVADRSLDDILATIVRHVVQVYGAANATILTRDDDDQLAVSARFPAGAAIPLSRNDTAVALQALSTGQPTGIATGRVKIKNPHGIGRTAIRRAPNGDVLYLPIDTPTRQIGVLEVRGRPNGGSFDDADRELLGSLADQATLALERVRLTNEAARADILARSDELKSALLASVSHDLRTPLATIKTAVSSLQDDSIDWPPDARSDFLEAIDEETDRLTRMVANLLDLSRIEGGALRPDRDWYDARELVRHVVDRQKARATASNHILTDHIEPGVTLGYFDYVEIDQVLANLIENAIKYTAAGSVIDVAVAVVPEGLRFSVTDDGPGIPAAQREQVFEKFYRAGNARSQQGTGIGLTISRGLVEAHGGRIWVESAAGGGTRVLLTIPFDRSALRDEASE